MRWHQIIGAIIVGYSMLFVVPNYLVYAAYERTYSPCEYLSEEDLKPDQCIICAYKGGNALRCQNPDTVESIIAFLFLVTEEVNGMVFLFFVIPIAFPLVLLTAFIPSLTEILTPVTQMPMQTARMIVAVITAPFVLSFLFYVFQRIRRVG